MWSWIFVSQSCLMVCECTWVWLVSLFIPWRWWWMMCWNQFIFTFNELDYRPANLLCTGWLKKDAIGEVVCTSPQGKSLIIIRIFEHQCNVFIRTATEHVYFLNEGRTSDWQMHTFTMLFSGIISDLSLSVCLSFCLSLCVSACLSVCLCV